MTKRTYVKPQWYAMGMPIAEAACTKGSEDVGTEGYCEYGALAAGDCTTGGTVIAQGTACRNGDSANYCTAGNNPTIPSTANCTTGNVAVG